ncbi:vWA domain-containing protein [Oceanobacillus halophilus]|uniref:vWA domain-containing protein n=1 Tax=Oceanobacillus halophilus TaxID=930130 RepID=UPI001314AE7F|nr:VWA domain-containing protein [Oceanobacillus halophilus]
MFKKETAIILFILVLMLSACTTENTTMKIDSENDENPVEVTGKDQTNDYNGEEESLLNEDDESGAEKKIGPDIKYLSDLETISLIDSREELKSQKGGLLVDGISIEDEVEDTNNKPLGSAQIIEIKEELENLTEHIQDPKELYKGIVYLLGSPNYKETIEKAESFKPEFEKPDLPESGASKGEISKSDNEKAIILLDASSSMLLSVDGQVKMDIAKRAVKEFGESIGADNDISLIVYGHKGSESEIDKDLSCNGIEVVYPMNSYNKAAFEQSLTTFESKGYTPLAGAIKKANEMAIDYSGPVTVYIVSDGVETCDGDPVIEAENFSSNMEEQQINVIGFDVDEEIENELKQISQAGNGSYYSADNAEELDTTIEKEWLPSYIDLAWAHTKAPGPWEILDEYDRFDVDLNKIREIIKIEKSRYDQAVQIIRVEQLTDPEVMDELSDIIIDEYRMKLDLMSELRSEKLEVIDQEAEEIRDMVDEWKEEMRQIKEQQDDLF